MSGRNKTEVGSGGFIACADEQRICSSRCLIETGQNQTKTQAEDKCLLERLGPAHVSVGRRVFDDTLAQCIVWGLVTNNVFWHHQVNTGARVLAKYRNILVYIRSFGQVGALQQKKFRHTDYMGSFTKWWETERSQIGDYDKQSSGWEWAGGDCFDFSQLSNYQWSSEVSAPLDMSGLRS